MIDDDKTYITRQGLKKLRNELEELKSVRRQEIAERIAAAKELGDLSENAEYAAAKTDQAFVEGRIVELESILKFATIIEEEVCQKGIVSVGSKIKIKEHSAEHKKPSVKQYHIVGSHEADPSAGRISNESPIGRSLLGAKKGDIVEISLPKGSLKCEVVEIK